MQKHVVIALFALLTGGCASSIVGSLAVVDAVESAIEVKKDEKSKAGQQGVDNWRELCKFNPTSDLCPQLNERSGVGGSSFFFNPSMPK